MGQVSSLLARTFTSSAPSEIDLEEEIPNLAPEERYSIMKFFDCKDLYAITKVNKVFNTVVKQYSELSLYMDKLDPDIWEKIGEVGEVPPIPEEFSKPRIGFNLVFIPEYITIEVDKNSGIELDKSFALDDKKARLIENPNSMGTSREIKVPLTLNNIIFLFQKFIPEFKGIFNSWQNIQDQHGDIGVGPSHWSYQRKEVIGLAESYQQQVKLATGDGLEIVPLTDRILFHLLSYMKTGQFPRMDYVDRTSTTTLDDQGDLWQSALWWPAFDSSFHLSLDNSYYDDVGILSVGAAVGVPVGSSEATE